MADADSCSLYVPWSNNGTLDTEQNLYYNNTEKQVSEYRIEAVEIKSSNYS